MPDAFIPQHQSLATSAAHLHDLVLSLPLWQIRLLWRVQDGIPLYDAGKAICVSPASIQSARRSSSIFDEVIALAEAGIPVILQRHAQMLARARGAEVVENWTEVMRRPGAADRDRINAGAKIAEAAGMIGQPATINVGVQVNQEQAEPWRLYQEHLATAKIEHPIYIEEQTQDAQTLDANIVEAQIQSSDDTPLQEPT